MSNSKSPLYSVLAILVSLVVLAGGAAKLYRGVGQLKESGANSKLDGLLAKSDSLAEEANRQSAAIAPAFQELLGDFDKLGVQTFRSEKREACAKLSEQFAAVSEQLHESSRVLVEATKHGTNEKTTNFLLKMSKSHEILGNASTQNMDIIRAILDESVVDVDVVVQKVQSIAESRDAKRKEASELAEDANAILKQAKM